MRGHLTGCGDGGVGNWHCQRGYPKAQVPDISARVEAKVDLWIAAAKALREQAAAMSSDRRGPRLNAADQYDYFAAELRALLDRPNGSE